MNQRIADRLVDEAITGELAEPCHNQVARVKQAKLHPLIGRNVADELHADFLPRGSARHESILDYPLPECLGEQRSEIGEPGLSLK